MSNPENQTTTTEDPLNIEALGWDGHPANPDQDGFHWLSGTPDRTLRFSCKWVAKHGAWEWNKERAIVPFYMRATFYYVGPIHDPDDLMAATSAHSRGEHYHAPYAPAEGSGT